MLTQNVIIQNPSGLHARPASAFVKITGKYISSIDFIKDNKKYNAKSILSVLSACVKCNEEIKIIINGDDEKEAMDSVIKNIQNGLGEKTQG